MLRADAEERALLGGLLQRPASLTEIPPVGVEDFYLPAHQLIYLAITQTLASDDDADVFTIKAWMLKNGSGAAINDGLLLAELVGEAPPISALSFFADRVTQAGLRRRIDQKLQRARQAIREGDFDDAIENVATTMVGIDVDMDAPASANAMPRGLWRLGEFVDKFHGHIDWIIPGLIGRQERIMVIAAEGSGKSMLARQLAVMTASGLHPFTRDPIPPRRTLLVDLENPEGIIGKKTRPMVEEARAMNLWRQDDAWIWHRPAGINLRKAPDRREFDRVLAIAQPGLVAFGPLYKAARTDQANSEQQAGETSEALDAVREKYGCALWIEHHAPMAQNGQRDLRPFGSGLWSRWPEFGLVLKKDDDPKIGARILHVDPNGFRNQRDERTWPVGFVYDRVWPWRPLWDADEVEDNRQLQLAGPAPAHRAYGWDRKQVLGDT